MKSLSVILKTGKYIQFSLIILLILRQSKNNVLATSVTQPDRQTNSLNFQKRNSMLQGTYNHSEYAEKVKNETGNKEKQFPVINTSERKTKDLK